MKKQSAIFLSATILALVFLGCGGATETVQVETPPSVDPVGPEQIEEKELSEQEKADAFLEKYFQEIKTLEEAQATAYWKASRTGKEEDFAAYAKADVELSKLHSDADRYKSLVDILAHKDELQPLTVRSLSVAELAFKGNQLPPDKIEAIAKASAEIEQIFASFRGEVDGKKYSDNELGQMIGDETDSNKRKAIWESMKQVGALAAPKLVQLAKLRNEAAKTMGYKNYWEMAIKLQEHDPENLVSIFKELEKVTDQPFKTMKTKLDKELSAKLKVKPKRMMPWHYDNPFFQAPPPSAKVNMDDFFKNKTKEDIVEIAKKFYSDVGLPIDSIVEKSDLFEREGKNQHAFCTTLNREGDIRTLLNIKPTASWMETMLHEQGHGIYDKYLDFELPYNLRSPAHAFTTEAVAMLFGALASNPKWLEQYAGADAKVVKRKEGAILEQRQREQLIFARWTMVMFNFEKALYENPDQDLNKLWWDLVVLFQGLNRPGDRNAPDWASKIHFAIAPVYYHNYMLGELMAAQIRANLKEISGHKGSTSTIDFAAHNQFADYFTNKIFKPAKTKPWPELVKDATGEPLTAKYFAAELQ